MIYHEWTMEAHQDTSEANGPPFLVLYTSMPDECWYNWPIIPVSEAIWTNKIGRHKWMPCHGAEFSVDGFIVFSFFGHFGLEGAHSTSKNPCKTFGNIYISVTFLAENVTCVKLREHGRSQCCVAAYLRCMMSWTPRLRVKSMWFPLGAWKKAKLVIFRQTMFFFWTHCLFNHHYRYTDICIYWNVLDYDCDFV